MRYDYECNVPSSVGLFAAIGVPLSAAAMANLASIFTVTQVKYNEIINKSITTEELEMLKQFGFENGDGYIDRAEFMVLCLMRLQVVDPVAISIIQKRYELLDHSHTGLSDGDYNVRKEWRDSISKAVSSLKAHAKTLRTSRWYVGRSLMTEEDSNIARKYAGRWRTMAALSSQAISPEDCAPSQADGNFESEIPLKITSQKNSDADETV